MCGNNECSREEAILVNINIWISLLLLILLHGIKFESRIVLPVAVVIACRLHLVWTVVFIMLELAIVIVVVIIQIGIARQSGVAHSLRLASTLVTSLIVGGPEPIVNIIACKAVGFCIGVTVGKIILICLLVAVEVPAFFVSVKLLVIII